jgi:hypothetical protein
MKRPPAIHTELVGILIGKIAQQSHPLVFQLYIKPNGLAHVRTTERLDTVSTAIVVQEAVKAYGAAVRGVWRNAFNPPWWFVSVYEGADPGLLYDWALPWSALALWRRWLPAHR